MSDRLEPKILDQISRLPDSVIPGEPALSEKVSYFGSQKAYLESLNLREVCYETFATLQDCIHKVQRHFDPTVPLKGTDLDNYQLLLDVTRQRNFLNIFNQNFRRVVNHITELSTYLSSKE